MTRSVGRSVAAGLILAAGFCVVAAAFALGLQSENPAASDFIGYWAVGQRLVHHVNPYELSAVLQLEHSVGYNGSEARLTPSPPVALLLVVPLGYVGAKIGLFLWTMAIFACLSLSLWVLWLAHGRPDTMIYLLGFLFAPAIACIQAGQLGVFFLLGIVLFLCLIKSRPMVAGAALLPCLLKPHLFVPLALALILWIIFLKAYRVLAGVALAVAVSLTVVVYFDRDIWTHYFAMMRSSALQDRYTPTLSVAFRLFVAWNAEWPRFVLLTGACIWAVWYFWTRRARWNWVDQGFVLLMVSILCSPYAWFTDEAALLPALLTVMQKGRHAGRSLIPLWLAGGVALLEILSSVKITSFYYLWTTPAWLGCYLYAMREQEKLQRTGERAPQTAGANE